MRINTRYINSTRRTSSGKDTFHLRPPSVRSNYISICIDNISLHFRHTEFRSCVKVGVDGRPGLPVLMSRMVSVDLKQHWTMHTHWSQFVPNMSTRHPRTLSSTSSSSFRHSRRHRCVKQKTEQRYSSPENVFWLNTWTHMYIIVLCHDGKYSRPHRHQLGYIHTQISNFKLLFGLFHCLTECILTKLAPLTKR